VSPQTAFDEDGRTATEAVTQTIRGARYLAEYAPLLDGSAGMRAVRAMVESAHSGHRDHSDRSIVITEIGGS